MRQALSHESARASGEQDAGPGLTRRRLLVVFAGAIAWGADWRRGGEDPSLTRVRQAGKLRVGIDPSYPPFANVDGAGQLGGFDVDLSREVSRRIGVTADFVGIDIGGLYDAVIAQVVDLAVGLQPAREYLTDLRYTRGYFNAGQTLVVRAGDQREPNPSMSFGVESGSGADLAQEMLRSRLGGATIRRASSLDVLQAEVRGGQIDGALFDAVTAYQIVKASPGLAIGKGPLTAEPDVMVLHKNDTRLLGEANTILAALESEGYLAGLVAKWLK